MLQVTGGMLQTIRDVENPVINQSHRTMLEEEKAATAVGQAMNKAKFGNDAYLVRPSEMVEVPSESARPADDLNENYEEDPDSASSESNKCNFDSATDRNCHLVASIQVSYMFHSWHQHV